MSKQKKIEVVVAEALYVDIEKVTDELKYQEIAEWDSMSHLILVAEIEKAYEISVEMEDILEMGSVAKIKDILKKYQINV